MYTASDVYRVGKSGRVWTGEVYGGAWWLGEVDQWHVIGEVGDDGGKLIVVVMEVAVYPVGLDLAAIFDNVFAG